VALESLLLFLEFFRLSPPVSKNSSVYRYTVLAFFLAGISGRGKSGHNPRNVTPNFPEYPDFSRKSAEGCRINFA
jgi:hypothetical protein